MTPEKSPKYGFFIDPGFKSSSEIIRDAAKWFLDLARNFIVVTVLFVLADRGDKWYLTALAWTGLFALWVYISAYWNALGYRFSPSTGLMVRLLVWLLALVAVGVVSMGSLMVLQIAVQEVARLQR